MEKTKERLLQVLTWLAWSVFRAEIALFYKPRMKVVCSKVRVLGTGIVIEGEIKKMKLEFGQGIDATFTPVGGRGFEEGTQQVKVIAQDADGNDRSGDFSVEHPVDGDSNRVKVIHSGENESTGVIRFQADGDRDADEEAILVSTVDFVVDEPNVTAIEANATVFTPTNEEPQPEPTPEEPTL